MKVNSGQPADFGTIHWSIVVVPSALILSMLTSTRAKAYIALESITLAVECHDSMLLVSCEYDAPCSIPLQNEVAEVAIHQLHLVHLECAPDLHRTDLADQMLVCV